MNKGLKIKSEYKKRVDIQVSILVAIVTLISSFLIFGMCYHVTYHAVIKDFQDQANTIYQKVDQKLNKMTFNRISEKKDTRSIAYEETRVFLNNLRKITGAKSIFTAKENDNGDLIYVVDGNYQGHPIVTYHAPGDLIEKELQKDMCAALDGKVVILQKMVSTSLGKYYRAFYPIFKDEKVVGAVGIIFETDNYYDTYRKLLVFAPIICIICCVISTYIAFRVFRRISNPNYKDVYNTDLLTGLKNRNAFEVDLNNINAKKDFGHRVVISADLNNLKKINDSFGHREGDLYIQSTADILSELTLENAVSYRTGGDEFTILIDSATEEQLKQWSDNVKRVVKNFKIGNVKWNSIAIGYAIFDEKVDENMVDTYKRADQEMYYDKKKQKGTR